MATVVGGGENGVRFGPPVPAEPMMGSRHTHSCFADGERRRGRILARGVHRVATKARDAPITVGPLVVALEVGVLDRPVVADAVVGSDSKVARHEAGAATAPRTERCRRRLR